MSCELCDKVWNNLKEYKNAMDNNPWDYDYIIFRSKDHYNLFLPCDDYYYNTSITINYCPNCGRKLIGG